MKIDLEQLSEVTRLVRAGQLRAATEAIQAALGQHVHAQGPTHAPSHAPPDVPDDVIDVCAHRVSPAFGSRSASSSPHVVDLEHSVQGGAHEGPGGASGAAQRFLSGGFSNGRDRRDYKLFIPSCAGQRPMPLVVMLHGCTQDPDDFAAGTAMNDLAQARGFYVLYPAQSRRANPQGCWNWFKHSHQQRGRGEPAVLAGMTRQVIADHNIDSQRVYVAGLSAGGAMAAILGDTYPDLFAAVGVHSGLASGSASDLPSALSAMKGAPRPATSAPSGVPTIVFHGDADATVHLRNGEQVIAACTGDTATVEVTAVQGPGVRNATRAIYRDVKGQIIAEQWTVHGTAHAWSGGRVHGTYTDRRGPDASEEMLRFFLEHPKAAATTSESSARRA